jgi:adenylate kinase family enzyme
MPSIRYCKRILVIGCGGAGKSTFARELGALLELPVIHLDRYYWKPAWQATPTDEWNVLVAELADQDEWIMDGNYGGSLSTRLKRCDAVVFFDFPRLNCLWGVVKRRLATGRRTKSDMAEGCPERITMAFVRWIWRYASVSRSRIVSALAEASRRVEIVTVSARRDVQNVLLACGTTPA